MVTRNRTSAVRHWQDGRRFSLSLKRLQDLTGLTYGSAVRLLMECQRVGVSAATSTKMDDHPRAARHLRPSLFSSWPASWWRGSGPCWCTAINRMPWPAHNQYCPIKVFLLPANSRLQPRSFINRQSRLSMPASRCSTPNKIIIVSLVLKYPLLDKNEWFEADVGKRMCHGRLTCCSLFPFSFLLLMQG